MNEPFNAAELLALRADTPACGTFAHFAHGSSSLPPTPVFAAQRAWLQAQEQHGTYRALKHARAELTAARQAVARLIGAQGHQVAFVDSSSRGWAMAFAAACERFKDLEVITTEHEWSANVMNLLTARQQGRIAELHVLYDGLRPAVRQAASALAAIVPSHRPLVALQVVNPVDGNLNDLAGIAEAVHERGGLLFMDASHAVGQLPVDVRQLGCDVLVFPARKWLRGPKGISVLYLSDRALDNLGSPPSLDISSAQWTSSRHCVAHADIRRFEAYEFNPGIRLALMAAADYAMQVGLGRIAAQNSVVRHKVQAALAGIAALRAIEPAHPTALMTYHVPEALATALLEHLEAAGINASLVGLPYARWALQARKRSVILRLTPHYLTCDAEIQRLREALLALPPTFAMPS